tara:strand:+ start:421 stop:1239 length:819 start_codon:yes stop_codon:yes gene_type:complete
MKSKELIDSDIIFDKYKDVFQFGTNENLDRVLIDNTLGFSNLKSFNDPFEMSYSYFHYVKNFEEALAYASKKYNNPENNLEFKVRKIINEELESIKVSCFSESPFEPLMWAHYANKHKGICYYFDKTKIFPRFGIIKSKKVTYSNSLSEIRFFEKTTSMDILKPQIESIIYTKSENWAYEKEYRYWKKTNDNSLKFNPESLKAIIVGFRNTKKDEIIKSVKEYNIKNGTDVKIIYSRPSPQFYKMIFSYKHGIKSSSTTITPYDLDDKPIKL